jgi:hypothetical protein
MYNYHKEEVKHMEETNQSISPSDNQDGDNQSDDKKTNAKPLLIIVGIVIIVCLVICFASSLFNGGSTRTTTKPKVSDEEQIESNLIRNVGSSTIRRIELSSSRLIIFTSLDRTSADTFYSDIGSIHGAVVRLNLNVNNVVLKDVSGQEITIPMSAMEKFSNKEISWDEFRDFWRIINP